MASTRLCTSAPSTTRCGSRQNSASVIESLTWSLVAAARPCQPTVQANSDECSGGMRSDGNRIASIEPLGGSPTAVGMLWLSMLAPGACRCSSLVSGGRTSTARKSRNDERERRCGGGRVETGRLQCLGEQPHHLIGDGCEPLGLGVGSVPADPHQQWVTEGFAEASECMTGGGLAQPEALGGPADVALFEQCAGRG